MFNVRYVITDKVADLWFRNIYYDRQIGATLGPEQPTTVIAADRTLEATQVNLIATLEGDADVGTPVGRVTVSSADGESEFELIAGSQVAAATLDSPAVIQR